MTLPRLLTERELHEQTGIPRRTLQKWRYEGVNGPPFIKLGTAGTKTSVRYVLADVEQWFESRTIRHRTKENPLDR